MKIGAVVLGALLTSVPAYAWAGTLTRKHCSEMSCVYEFKGEIVASDVASFTAIKPSGDQTIGIFLDSDGGDVRAAIKIARHLQEIMASTSDAIGGRCASACVIVLAASPIRMGSKIGIHRVYTTSTEGTFAERQSDFDQIGAEVKALFRRSGVPESLWEDMQRIPPESVKWLTLDEVFHYRLFGQSPAVSDYQDAKHAKRLGISKQELLRRRAQAEKHCKIPPNTTVNEESILKEAKCRNKITGDDKLIEEEIAKWPKVVPDSAASR